MKTFSKLISDQQQRQTVLFEGENQISTKSDFYSYAKKLAKDAYGDKYNDKKVEEFLSDLIKARKDSSFDELIAELKQNFRGTAEKHQELIERLIESIVDNPVALHNKLINECIQLDPALTVQKIAAKSLKFLGLLGTTEYEIKPIMESLNISQDIVESTYFNYNIQNPQHLINICEALESVLGFAINAKKPIIIGAYQRTINDMQPFEKYARQFGQYRKNYTDIIANMSHSADQDKLIFDRFIADMNNLYYFTPAKLIPLLNNPQYFIYLCICYMNKFTDIHYDLLNDRGFSENLNICAETTKQYREGVTMLNSSVYISPSSINYSKLYNMWDVVSNLKAVIAPNFREICSIYLRKVKPMIDMVRIYSELRKHNAPK